MSTLTTDQLGGTELPVVALVRMLLAPAVCTLVLGLALLACGEPFAVHYAALSVVSFLVTTWAFGDLPFPNGRPGASLALPGHAIFIGWLKVVGVLLFVAFVTKVSGLYSRKVLMTWFALTPFAIHIAQEFTRMALHRLIAMSAAGHMKVVVGVNESARALARQIGQDPLMGTIAGYFDDRSADRLASVAPREIIGGLADVAGTVKRDRIKAVYITLPITREPRMVRLLDDLRDTTASIYFVPSTLPFEPIQARLDFVGGVPVIAVCETPFHGINGVLKRVLDLAVATVALLLIWPVMLAIAVAIKLGSPGPVLFKQRRYGLDGAEIAVYKFRTMTVCEDGERIAQAQESDPRITPLGAVLRRLSLDELPQLLNVIAGTMSVVGPRPHAVAHNEMYRRLIDGYMVRHKVKPGITGWAQVNGLRGETETLEKMKQRVEHDLDYLKHWSISLDLWILVKTVGVVLHGRNAH
jgi:putative colanic acid biosysnthesis UDP-glucose lipid carrier transferase